MEDRDELDRVIDGALARYSGAEPLAGLEERVLNRVRVVETGRRWRLAWAFALVAAVVVVAVVMRTPRQPVLKSNGLARVIAPAPVRPAPAVEKERVVAKRPVRAKARRQRVLPKQEQFPAPAPMTAEERALVAFVGQHPAEARQVFAELQKSDEPIEIQPIQIPPLRSDGAQ
jgi:hypothetical protein